jgi:hypothetical protein
VNSYAKPGPKADLTELELAEARGELVPRAALEQGLLGIAETMTQILRASHLSRDEQRDLLRELSSIGVVVADVAERSRRGRGEQANGNGEKAVERKRSTEKQVKPAEPESGEHHAGK